MFCSSLVAPAQQQDGPAGSASRGNARDREDADATPARTSALRQTPPFTVTLMLARACGRARRSPELNKTGRPARRRAEHALARAERAVGAGVKCGAIEVRTQLTASARRRGRAPAQARTDATRARARAQLGGERRDARYKLVLVVQGPRRRAFGRCRSAHTHTHPGPTACIPTVLERPASGRARRRHAVETRALGVSRGHTREAASHVAGIR